MNVLRSGCAWANGLSSGLHQQQGLLLGLLRVRLSLNLLNLLLLGRLLLLDGDVGLRLCLLQLLRDAGTAGSITGGKDLLLLLLTDDGLLLDSKLLGMLLLLLLRLESGPSDGDDVCGRSGGNDLLHLLLLLLWRRRGRHDLGLLLLLDDLLNNLQGRLIAWKHARIGRVDRRRRRRCGRHVTDAG